MLLTGVENNCPIKLLGSLLRQNPDSWLAFVAKNQDLSIGSGAS